MPRRRVNAKYPKGVNLMKGAVYYTPYIPKKERSNYPSANKYGYLPAIKLGDKNTPIEEIWAQYATINESIKKQKSPDVNTLNWLSEQYQNHARFKEKAPKTQKSYIVASKILDHEIKINGQPASLGQLKPEHITPPLIRQILDKRLDQRIQEGQAGTSATNRERSYLSTILSWGIEYIEGVGISVNPCKEIKKYKENIRDRYVTDEEYAIQYQFAQQFAPAWLPVFFEFSYLLASRSIEAIDLTMSDCTELGIIVDRRKGSKTTLIKWNARLHAAHQAALKLHNISPIETSPLIVYPKMGTAISESGKDTAMQRLKKKMSEAGLQHIYWSLHDLKRKGISDAEDKSIAGHSPAMQHRYNVNPQYDAPSNDINDIDLATLIKKNAQK